MATTLRTALLSATPLRAGALILAALAVACSDSKPAAPKPAEPSAPAPSGKESSAKGAEGAAKGAPAQDGAKPKGGKGEASATLAYQTGLQLLLKGDPERARDEFQRAVKLDPKMDQAFFELGRLLLHLSSKVVGSQSRDLDILDKGIAALTQAVALAPSNDVYAYWLGRAYAMPGKNDSATAVKHLTHALELNPKNAAAWKSLGLVQMGEAQTETARDSFKKSIEMDPTDSGAYFQLGMTLEVLSDLPGARSAYEKSVELDPTQSDVYGKLKQLLARVGDADGEAKAEERRAFWEAYDIKLHKRMMAVNKTPSDAAALRRLGEMYFQVGKWSDALEWFMKAIHIDPKDSLAHLYCGIVARNLKDYENSANHLKEAEFLAPDNLDPKLELVRLYAETKDEKSLTELVASVETAAAADGQSLFDLGTVCQEIGRTEDATRLLDKAKALGVTQAASAAPTEGG